MDYPSNPVNPMNFKTPSGSLISDATHYSVGQEDGDWTSVDDIYGTVAVVDNSMVGHENMPDRVAAALNTTRYIPTDLLSPALVLDLLETIGRLYEYMDPDDLPSLMSDDAYVVWRAAIGKEAQNE